MFPVPISFVVLAFDSFNLHIFMMKTPTTAQTPLRKSLSLSTTHIPTLVLLGETLINIGNLHDTDSDSDSDEEGQKETDGDDEEKNPAIKYYKEAFELFKKAREIDAESLPEQFVEFVEEWEKDL